MTDYEKLVALIDQSLKRHIDKSCKLAENIASDLLAGGVIVPLCKAGEKVYRTDGVRVYEETVRGLEALIYGTGVVYFSDKSIGTYIFLTREEAVAAIETTIAAALAEREGKTL